jgi:hypothetical protein
MKNNALIVRWHHTDTQQYRMKDFKAILYYLAISGVHRAWW